MVLLETPFPEVKLFQLQSFSDARVCFFEGFHRERYARVGFTAEFKQDNYSISGRGVLRGMHFQNPNAQGKLVGVLQGAVYDVVVDIRRSSQQFGQWYGVELNADNMLQIYIPPGFAHGFVSLADSTITYYKCTDFYVPSSEWSLLWNDPAVGIRWPVDDPLVSDRDKKGIPLAGFSEEVLFH